MTSSPSTGRWILRRQTLCLSLTLSFSIFGAEPHQTSETSQNPLGYLSPAALLIFSWWTKGRLCAGGLFDLLVEFAPSVRVKELFSSVVEGGHVCSVIRVKTQEEEEVQRGGGICLVCFQQERLFCWWTAAQCHHQQRNMPSAEVKQRLTASRQNTDFHQTRATITDNHRCSTDEGFLKCLS